LTRIEAEAAISECLYRKKDIHIAMVKNFLELVENDIGKVKIEKN